MHKLSWNSCLDMEPSSDPPGLRSVPGSRLDGNSVSSERRRQKSRSNASESELHPVCVVSILAQGVHLIARLGSDIVGTPRTRGGVRPLRLLTRGLSC